MFRVSRVYLIHLSSDNNVYMYVVVLAIWTKISMSWLDRAMRIDVIFDFDEYKLCNVYVSL